MKLLCQIFVKHLLLQSLLITYTTNAFPGEYIPTVFDNYAANVMVDDKPMQLGLWDAFGGRGDFEDQSRFRPLSYPQTDIFLICFSVCNKENFQNIETLWVPEIKHHCPGVPWILVGTKSDLRDAGPDATDGYTRKLKASDFVSTSEAEALVKKLKGKQYIECSALKMTNLKTVFDQAIRCVFLQV